MAKSNIPNFLLIEKSHLRLACLMLVASFLQPAYAQQNNASRGGNEAAAIVENEANEPASDESVSEEPPSQLTYIAPQSYEMRIGLKLTSGSPMSGTKATTVFPTAWPEQDVEIVETSISPVFKRDFRELPGNNKQLLLFAASVPGNAINEATVKVRITKRHIVAPSDTSELVVPRRVPRELRNYLTDSPYIKVRQAPLIKAIREIDAEEPESDWERIEMFYDWVRENIEYRNGELKTLQVALKEKAGDCEEMTAAFVAMCRSARIPARCVWIPNHCYPEFYMEDGEGNGQWFPCQVAGTRNFGAMPEYLPILQKGDRFVVPEKPGAQRYVADFLTAKRIRGTKNPKVEFVRELLGQAASFRAPDADLAP